MLRYAFLIAIAGVISLGTCTQETFADLEINLDFSNFATNAPADGSAVLGGGTRAQAQAVIESAADYWEEVFAGSNSALPWTTNVGGTLTQNISVGWGSLGGSTLATGGTNWVVGGNQTGRWGSGSLTWDNDGSSTFFVDTTPLDSVEWNQFSSRDINLGGTSVNVERTYYDAPAGSARNDFDMLTTAVHEIGHALGFLGTPYPQFAAADLQSDGDIDIVGGPLAGAEIPFEGGHTEIMIDTPGNGDFPYDPGANSFFPTVQYNPTLMGPSGFNGTRSLLTEADIAVVAQILQFDQATVNFDARVAAVPEPSTISLLAVCLVGVAGRRRRTA